MLLSSLDRGDNMSATIDQILSKANTKVIIEDEKLGKLEWVLRPIPAFDLLANFELFSSLPKDPKDLNPELLSTSQSKKMQDSIFPIMKIVLPACSVSPKITVDDDDPNIKAKTAIHMRDLPFNVVLELFNQIMEISGLDERSEEIRKKLQAQNSASV